EAVRQSSTDRDQNRSDEGRRAKDCGERIRGSSRLHQARTDDGSSERGRPGRSYDGRREAKSRRRQRKFWRRAADGRATGGETVSLARLDDKKERDRDGPALFTLAEI